MTATPIVEFAAPYLVFLGDSADLLDAKTGLGIAHWRRERCLAQLRLPGCAADARRLNSANASAEARRQFSAGIQERLGLPCVDPIIDGAGAIVDYLEGMMRQGAKS